MVTDDLEAQLEDIFADIDLSDVEDLTLLSSGILLDRVADLTHELKQRHEALHPKTQEARDMHSTRNACQVELRRRKILPS